MIASSEQDGTPEVQLPAVPHAVLTAPVQVLVEGSTNTVMRLLVGGVLVDRQIALLVITHLIISVPSGRVLVVYEAELPLCTLVDPTKKLYTGEVPPLTGVAVKVNVTP